MERPLTVVCALAMLLIASAVAAEDAGNVGLTIAYPGAVGVQWHLTDRVALRPEVALSRTWNGAEPAPIESGGFVSAQESWYVTVEVHALIYVGKWDRLQAYVTPGYSYSRNSTGYEVGLSEIPATIEPFEFDTTTHGVRGALGLQYALHERFSVYAEAGLRYDKNTAEAFGSASSFHTIGSSTALGAVFYFSKR